MGAEPQHRDIRREERHAWCADRRLGDHTAVFYPGDELRCPATRRLSGGASTVCGASMDLWAKPQQQVIVRVRTFRDALSATGLDGLCHVCRSKLEVFTLREATG